jgi:alanine dehydrogenase
MKILTLSQKDLITLGLTEKPAEIVTDVKRAMLAHGRGKSISDKLALIPDREWVFKKFCADESIRKKYSDVDLDQKLSALNAINESAACVKIVGGSALNRERGIPRSESLIIVYTNDTFLPVCLMRGTEISALRTGAYAAIVGEYLMPEEQGNIVALVGSGKIAESCLICMDCMISDRIAEIRVFSRTAERREGFVKMMKSKVSMNLKAAGSVDEAVKDADYVITVTTARKPLVYNRQLKRNVTLLLLGANEVGTCYLKRCYNKGLIFCDDWRCVKHRNVQSLALFYNKMKDKKGEINIEEDRIIELWELVAGTFDIKKVEFECVLVNCVGMSDFDLEIAFRMYKKALAERVGNYIEL